MNSLETDLHNYKSLYEEIAQEDNNYLQNNTISNTKYSDEQCCCCNVHRRENNLYNSTATATTTTTTMTLTTTTTTSRKSSFSSYNYYDKMPIYNSIWLGEMRNATDYIEYLNKTRRNSNNNNGNASHQANKDRTNYYKLSTSDYHSLNHDNDMNNNCNSSSNFLQVPKFTMDEELRRTPEFDDIYRKISEINHLDNSVSALIYKSIEVHADILSLDATVSRLLAETRELLEEMEDVRCLDQIIEMLNSESVFHPIIHHEWKYHITNANEYPVEEGIPVA